MCRYDPMNWGQKRSSGLQTLNLITIKSVQSSKKFRRFRPPFFLRQTGPETMGHCPIYHHQILSRYSNILILIYIYIYIDSLIILPANFYPPVYLHQSISVLIPTGIWRQVSTTPAKWTRRASATAARSCCRRPKPSSGRSRPWPGQCRTSTPRSWIGRCQLGGWETGWGFEMLSDIYIIIIIYIYIIIIYIYIPSGNLT